MAVARRRTAGPSPDAGRGGLPGALASTRYRPCAATASSRSFAADAVGSAESQAPPTSGMARNWPARSASRGSS
jgi:hypothetical protein